MRGHGRGAMRMSPEPEVSECIDETLTHWSCGLGVNCVKPSPPIHKTSFSDNRKGLDFRSHNLSGPNSASLSPRAWATQNYDTQVSSTTGKKSLS